VRRFPLEFSVDIAGNPLRGPPASPFIIEVVLSVRRIREYDMDLDGEFVKRLFYCQLIPPGAGGYDRKAR
jgi:hypothetical protein